MSFGRSALRIALRPTTIPTRTLSRTFHTTPRHSAGAGLTNLFDPTDPSLTDLSARPRLSVASLSASTGFTLSDGLTIPGGCILHSNRIFLWDVDAPGVDPLTLRGDWAGWDKQRLEVLEVLVPRPEILLLGTGGTVVPPPVWLREYVSSLGISLDVMDTRNASSTFNLLTEEGRTVAAALMPLRPIDPRNYLPRSSTSNSTSPSTSSPSPSNASPNASASSRSGSGPAPGGSGSGASGVGLGGAQRARQRSANGVQGSDKVAPVG